MDPQNDSAGFFLRRWRQRRNWWIARRMLLISLMVLAGSIPAPAAVASPGVFFSTSKLRLTLPISKESYIILRSEPIVNLRLLSTSGMQPAANASQYHYTIEVPSSDAGYLTVDEKTGDLWITSKMLSLANVTEFIIVAENGSVPSSASVPVARLSLTIDPQPVKEDSLDSFCEHHPDRACFWDAAQYRVAENGPAGGTIGTLGPAIYRRLCPQHQVRYALQEGTTGSDYLLLDPNDGTLRTKVSFDHDSHAPGPTLLAGVRCAQLQQLADGSQSSEQTVNRTVTVTVLDRNDNLPRHEVTSSGATGDDVQVYLDDPHVNQGDPVGHFRIVFTDDDSIPVNTRVHYRLLGDLMELLRVDCAMYENEHDDGLKQTVFGCKLLFARSGILRQSPYCVTLQAVDPTVERTADETRRNRRRSVTSGDGGNVTICITTNLNRIHEYDLPRPEALTSNNDDALRSESASGSRFETKPQQPQQARRKSKKDVTTPAKIAYPKEVVVYDTSRKYARIAEPRNFKQLLQQESGISDLSFHLTSNPLDAFGITRVAGIIYLKNETAFNEKSLESRHEITVSWKNYSVNILVRMRKNPDAGQCAGGTVLVEGGVEDFCAIHPNRTSCLGACGIGSLLGPCEYRSRDGPPGSFSPWSEDYPTCSSGLTHCPDGICDPLEEMGHREKIHICPQDCVFKPDIVGVHDSDKPRGIHTAVGHCSCRSTGHCSCVDNLRIHSSNKRNKTTTTTTSSSTTTTTTTTTTTEASETVAGPGEKARDVELLTVSSTELNDTENVPPAAVRDGSVYEPGLIKGPHASIYLLAIVLIPMILAVMIVSYCFSRKIPIKGKLIDNSGNSGLNSIAMNLVSNDTEIFNVELPLTSRMNEINFKIDYDSKWEFPRTNLILDATLGEGEFGKVLKGFATDLPEKPGITTVAVKMLKTGANSVELLALLSEYQLLQEVNHPNVIRLLGACTKGDSPLLIIEYCQYGSLKNYLRLSRKLEVLNADYENSVEPITVKDILSFAWQISKGMAYLTDIKLVHRDLAARNVLLAEGKVCKISDFGLTRDVYEDDAYLKKSKDRVPVKWMAPESLADHIYTTKSDVWAFGVLCWELITLGASPYPGIPPQNLYNLLKQGYRMECPKNCSEEIYSIVRSCWADDPKQRPSFKHLAGQFELLLGRSAKYIDMEQNSISNPVYCVNVDEVDCAKIAICKEEQDRLESLWTPPQYETVHDNSNTSELAGRYQTPTSSAITLSEDKKQLLLQSYDTPRPLIETATIEQKLRYENDVRLRPKMLNGGNCDSGSLIEQHLNSSASTGSPASVSSSRGSTIGGRTRFEETSFIELAASNSSSAGEYDSPSRQPRRVLSYLDMNKQGQQQQLLSANLEISHMIDKKQSKDIALRFSNVDNELQMVLVDPRTGDASAVASGEAGEDSAPSNVPLKRPPGAGPTTTSVGGGVEYSEIVKIRTGPTGHDKIGHTLTSLV
ncbi:uncharacterized protein LOC126581250 [Anopheles aquasalis]|uniref:uncharacterized protein LOC126581250 n=1 Tax=Anopheles aquasalis TaxID=42839 RepID=UPI00215A156B|nr:uncharacterized protein LOC126581250 [Anopheles aquasalis]